MIYIILPAFNEEKVIARLVRSLNKVLKRNNLAHKIVIVNDGSIDNTLSISKRLEKERKVKVIDHGINKGLGEALNTGFRFVLKHSNKGDIVITMDADNTHPGDLIPEMVRLIKNGNDLVIASRYLPQSKTKGLSKNREFLSIIASTLFFLIFPFKGVKDYTCGYRAYKADILNKAFKFYGKKFINQKGFSCMVDILLKLKRFNPKVCEVPLELRYDRKIGKSKMNVSLTVLSTIKLLIQRRLGFYL